MIAEYVTGTELIQTLKVIFPMILFSMFVSLLVVYSWIMKFVLSAIDFIDDMRERKDMHSAHVRVYYKANFRLSSRGYVCIAAIFTLFCFAAYMFYVVLKSPQMM